MRRRAWYLVVLALLAALAVAGCGSKPERAAPPAATTTTTSRAPTTTTTTTTPPASSTSSSPAGTTATGTTSCATSQLSGSLADAAGTAGSTEFQLVLTDTASTSCVIQGFPGVSFVAGSDGHQVGAAALQPANLAPGSPVTLAPGQAAYAPLAVGDARNYPASCQLTTVLGLRVYPPGQYTALYIPHTDQACANRADTTLSIDPVAATPTG